MHSHIGCHYGVFSSRNQSNFPIDCIDILGMENQLISDSQLWATSERSHLSGAKHARANTRKLSNVRGMPDSDGGWIPSSFTHGQFLRVDFGKKMKVSAVETQGADGHNYWVTQYHLEYSQNGHSWTKYPQV